MSVKNLWKRKLEMEFFEWNFFEIEFFQWPLQELHFGTKIQKTSKTKIRIVTFCNTPTTSSPLYQKNEATKFETVQNKKRDENQNKNRDNLIWMRKTYCVFITTLSAKRNYQKWIDTVFYRIEKIKKILFKIKKKFFS